MALCHVKHQSHPACLGGPTSKCVKPKQVGLLGLVVLKVCVASGWASRPGMVVSPQPCSSARVWEGGHHDLAALFLPLKHAREQSLGQGRPGSRRAWMAVSVRGVLFSKSGWDGHTCREDPDWGHGPASVQASLVHLQSPSLLYPCHL